MALLKNDEDISQLPFVAFDFETTGLSAGKDKIVEIGGVKFQNRVTFASIELLVYPGFPMPPEVTKINGITDEMLEGKPPIEEALLHFLDFIRGSVLIAHNASFDMGFLTAAVRALKKAPIENPVLDTLQLARNVLPGQQNYKLQTLAAQFGIDPGNAHRAKDDSAVCRDVFYKCLERVEGGTSMSLDKLLAMGAK